MKIKPIDILLVGAIFDVCTTYLGVGFGLIETSPLGDYGVYISGFFVLLIWAVFRFLRISKGIFKLIGKPTKLEYAIEYAFIFFGLYRFFIGLHNVNLMLML